MFEDPSDVIVESPLNAAELQNHNTIYIKLLKFDGSESCVTSQTLHIFVIETNDVMLALRNNILLTTSCSYVSLLIYNNFIGVI